jgi:hypothetical protein
MEMRKILDKVVWTALAIAFAISAASACEPIRPGSRVFECRTAEQIAEADKAEAELGPREADSIAIVRPPYSPPFFISGSYWRKHSGYGSNYPKVERAKKGDRK